MKKRLREGAKLIVIDPRRIDLVRMPHERGLSLAAPTRHHVAILSALAHVIVTEGLVNEAFVRERCDWDERQGEPRPLLRQRPLRLGLRHQCGTLHPARSQGHGAEERL
jgi:anaerobic selenocysteine-containing dehydrogenase